MVYIVSFSFVALEIFMTEFFIEFGTYQQMTTTEWKKFQLICSHHIARSALSKKYYSFWERRETKKKLIFLKGMSHGYFFSLHKENWNFCWTQSSVRQTLWDMPGEHWQKKSRSFITVVEKHTVKTWINFTGYSLPIAASGLRNKNFYNEKRAQSNV